MARVAASSASFASGAQRACEGSARVHDAELSLMGETHVFGTQGARVHGAELRPLMGETHVFGTHGARVHGAELRPLMDPRRKTRDVP